MTDGLKLAPNLTLPTEAVTQTFGILAKRGAGKSNAAAVMAEEMYRVGLQFVAVDPVGARWGLRSSRDGKGPGLAIPVLGGYHGDIPLEPTAGELVADLVVDERLSCVIDVSAFDSEGQKRKFLISFAERLFRQKGKPGREEPLHLFLEEADDYAPQRASGIEMNRCLGAFQRIVKRGRSRGLGSTMISQRSAALNKDLLTQIDTLIVLRTTSPNDRKAVEGWVTFHDVDQEIISSLSGLKAGEAWVWSPEFLDLTKRVQIRRRNTFDSGATPTAGAKRRAPSTLADVDLGALQARMKETIERAKSEDPKELRQRIRELEHALKDAVDALDVPTASGTVQVEIVEVPVLTESNQKTLRDLMDALGTYHEAVLDLFMKTGTVDGQMVEWWGDLQQRLKLPSGDASPRREASAAPETGRNSSGRRASVGREAGRARPVSDPAPSPSGEVTKPQIRILDALAWLESVGVTQANRTQVALLAKTSPKSSGYANNLGAMRTSGWIDYPSRGTLALTSAGRKLADPPAAPPTNEALWETLESVLSPARWRILTALIDVYPNALTRDDLADRAGTSASSSGYANNLGGLRSLGFLDYPSRGTVVATDVLFLE